MKIALIGFGNLGRAFASGLLNSGYAKKGDITVCAKTDKTLETAKSQYGFNAEKSAADAVKNADLVVFALKADGFFEVAGTLDLQGRKNMTVISLMAGVCIDKIRQALGFEGGIIRAMPSLAVAGANGIIGYTKTENKEIISLFQGLGLSFAVEERDIEKITALSACGLGFAAYIIDCLASAGCELGLDEKLCGQIARRSFENAARAEDLKQTVSAVATKGGATEKGLAHMTENNLPGVINGAFKSAYDKVKGTHGTKAFAPEPVNEGSQQAATSFIAEHWHGTDILIRGEVIDMTKSDGFVIFDGDTIIGLITYIIKDGICEIISLDSLIPNRGIGTMLINRVVGEAKSRGCRRVQLITTNDNINAIRFYQKRGFELAGVNLFAIDREREKKPQIPLIGQNGIPLRHEVEFAMALDD